MNLIVGLGNPGKEYENTRHNVGFEVLDRLTGKEEWKYSKKFIADICHVIIEGQDIYLVKPQTFMNMSGKTVMRLVSFLNVPLERVWVTHDDIDLDLGTVRIRKEGSSGGHNGVQSLINNLGSEGFPRFKIGIRTQRAEAMSAERFVLEKFSEEELKIVNEATEKAASEIKRALKEGIEHVSI